MHSHTTLTREGLVNAELPIPQENLADLVSSAQELSRTLTAAASRLQMSDFDIDFANTLQELSVPPIAVEETKSRHTTPSNGSLKAVQTALAAIASSSLGTLTWVRFDRDTALKKAQELDDAVASGQKPGLLHGTVFGLKDMFDRAGHTAQWGSILRADVAPAQYDATVVARLKAAGAIDLGSLHMAEFALSPTGLNVHLGQGRNPLNHERVSGGSSSGCGMAIGAGHVPLTIGSDTAGSVRLPAAFCGVFGLKPTQYRVSSAGAMPLSPSLDCIGPLANSVDVCADAFAVMAGADLRDSSCLPLPPPVQQWRTLLATSLVVSIPRIPAGAPVSASMREALKEIVSRLKDQGVRCMEVELPDMDLLGKLASIIMATESSALHRMGLARQAERYGSQVRRRLSRGFLLGATDHCDAMRLRSLMLRSFMAQTLAGAHACLLPAAPSIAPLISETTGSDARRVDRVIEQLSYWTRPVNYLGLPALCLPAGAHDQSMPLGIQLVGAPLGEDHLFALGNLLST
jgi:aspartyl-tRNA(Asn)/glutamyl-tRNA(Gln) amidotransferase subunit A